MGACVGLMAIALGTGLALVLAALGGRSTSPIAWMDALAVGALIAPAARGERGLSDLVATARWVALIAGLVVLASLPAGEPACAGALRWGRSWNCRPTRCCSAAPGPDPGITPRDGCALAARALRTFGG